jgi:hypothetical protein
MARRIEVFAWVAALASAASAPAAAANKPSSVLSAVSCTRPSSCTAVLSSILTSSSGQDRGTLIAAERWNGRRWVLETMPNPAFAILTAVSCSAPAACTAVGSHAASLAARRLTLAERWNGRRWAIQPTPSPSGLDTLTSISCSSARACVAAGFRLTPTGHSATLVERWDGHHWQVVPAPSPGKAGFAQLSAVSCSAPDACTAVGAFGTAGGRTVALAERWNGRRWSVQGLPRPAGASYLNGISCSSATACTAVGDYVPPVGATVPHTLAMRWDGMRWRIEPTPSVSGRVPLLLAVSCSAPSACTTVGTHGPALAERWDGTRWTVQPTPSPHAGAQLGGVSCTSAASCTAVGNASRPAGETTLAERWNGRRWSIQRTLNPS